MNTTIALVAAIVAAATLVFAQEPPQREMTEEDKARIAAKAEELVKAAQKLDETNQRLAAVKERIRAKFAPKVEDEPDILWGKMLRFRACKMPDDACLALDLIRRKKSPDFHSDAIKVAKALCRLDADAPTVEGVMISSYEPPATSHAIFKPGDIVVACDGTPIRRVPDWKTNVGGRYRFWRLGADGKFQLMEAILPAGQPRVGLLNIAEKQE